MAVMIKLKLQAPNPSLQDVLDLPGMRGLQVDEAFGLICISPKDQLYVVRVQAIDNLEGRRKQSPEILGAYGDVRIAPFR